MNRNKRYLVASAVAVTLACTASAAIADQPHTVDPLTMTPALNPEFDPWTCFEAGSDIICQGAKVQSWVNIVTGIECDGTPVYATGTEHAAMTRWHTPEGLALKTELQTRYSERFSLSTTGEGNVVIGSGHWHKHYVYPEPGNPDTRVLTETGAVARLQSPGDGILFQDTGTVTYVPGSEYEVVEEMHGIHERYGGDALPDEIICAALTGP